LKQFADTGCKKRDAMIISAKNLLIQKEEITDGISQVRSIGSQGF
jgi:hypothetical protein